MAQPDHQPQKIIRPLRQERGWSQAALAWRVGVTRRSILRWEGQQRRPQPRARLRLAELVGVSVEELACEPAEQAPG